MLDLMVHTERKQTSVTVYFYFEGKQQMLVRLSHIYVGSINIFVAALKFIL